MKSIPYVSKAIHLVTYLWSQQGFRTQRVLIAILLYGFSFLMPPAVLAKEKTSDSNWWKQMESIAAKSGYHLVSVPEVEDWIKKGETFRIIDVRPEYEFSKGHLPEALNIEFDLSSRTRISKAKRKRFLELLGEDKSRKLLIYCRSHQCIRSELAANWAVRLGYKNVFRMPKGYLGWQNQVLCKETENPVNVFLNQVFPECQFVSINRKLDQDYLGFKRVGLYIRLVDIQSRFIYVTLFNEMCSACIEEIKQYRVLFKHFQSSSRLNNIIKVVAIGAGSSNRSAKKFVRENQIPFPFFADKKWDVFKCLGEPVLPIAYLLEKQEGSLPGLKIVMIKKNHTDDLNQLLKQIESYL